jgi:hypothetical protein
LDILNDDMSIRTECLVSGPGQAALGVEQQRVPAGGDSGDGSAAGGGEIVAGMSAGLARLLADD